MFRALFTLACVLSLVVCAATAVARAHSRRAWHTVVWRTDAAAEAEGAHRSPADVWREFREGGKPPGMRNGRKVRPVVVHAFQPAPQPAVEREYASLVLADGVLELRRYPEPPCRVPI